MTKIIEEFMTAWDALYENDKSKDGLCIIQVATFDNCEIYAGRNFPGNYEAMLVHFPSLRSNYSDSLPQGKGFQVSEIEIFGKKGLWIGLCRRGLGQLDLFNEMVSDIVRIIKLGNKEGEQRSFFNMIKRILMWQQFMERNKDDFCLSLEKQIGLIGELSFLSLVMEAGMLPELALMGWMGPDDNPKDFLFDEIGVEVKSSLRKVDNFININSLDQLDIGSLKSLFLFITDFENSSDGITLPQKVNAIESMFLKHSIQRDLFWERLSRYGFYRIHSDQYLHRFLLVDCKFYGVKNNFPRLCKQDVSEGVIEVHYKLDKEFISPFEMSVNEILSELRIVPWI